MSMTTPLCKLFQSLESFRPIFSNRWKSAAPKSVILLALLFSVSSATVGHADTGWLNSYAFIWDGSSDTFYDLNGNDQTNGKFHDKNLGTFTWGDTLFLNAQINAWADGGDTFNRMRLHWRLGTSGTFNILETTDITSTGGNNHRGTVYGANLMAAANGSGTFTVQMFVDRRHTWSGGSFTTYLNRNGDTGGSVPSGSFFTATFTVNKANQTGVSGTLGDSSVTIPVTTTVTATGGQSGGAYEFRQNGGTGSVSFSGSGSTRTITPITAGTAVIEVRKLEDSKYNTSAWVSAGTLTINPAAPAITISESSRSFGDVAVNGTSANQTYTVSGVNLTAPISISAPTGFQIMPSGGSGFASSLKLTQSGGTVASTTIYARFAPGSAGAFSGNISHTSSGATSQNVAVTGTGIAAPGAPTASARTSPELTSFVANWSAGSGGTPTNYFVDVARDSGFTSMVSGYNNRSVGNVTSVTVTNLAVGEYYYRVRAQNLAGTSGNSGVITARTSTAQHRNAGGASAPYSIVPSPSGTYYVGDTLTFRSRSWGDIDGDQGRARLWVHTDTDVRDGSSSSSWGDFSADEERARSWKFTSAGTYYWGMQIDYGGTYGTNFWYVRDTTDWASMDYNGTNGNLTVTITALSPPTSPSVSANSSHLATALDLSWTRWNSRNVLIVRRAGEAVSWTPSNNTSYTDGQDLGGGHVVVRASTGSTNWTDHNLLPGITYHYAFFSENGNYYSATSTTANRATARPQARNTGGSATPQQPSTVYLGDTARTFGLDSWGTITRDGNENFGRARLWIRHNNADLSGGTSTDWTDFVNTVNKTRSSPQFTQTGTWYWGIQMDYGSPYGSGFWYKNSSSSYTAMAADGDGATLSVTVSALQAPDSFTATTSGANEVNLAWSRWESRSVLIVRREGAAVSWTPDNGTSYSTNQDVGDGHTVLRGSLADDEFSDAGLTAGVTYHYAIFSENFGYYSAAATASATTDKESQTITFGALDAKTYGDSTFTLSATASSGLTVSFSSLNTDVATVDGTTVTIVGAGTATIRASQAGNATYDAAPNVDRTLTVSQKSVTGSFVASNKAYDGTTDATVTGRSLSGVVGSDDVTLSGGTATFASANVGTGITVTLAGATLAGAKADNYTLSSVSTATADITKADQTITFAGGAWQTKQTGDAAFDLEASSTSGLSISFTSSNTDVATVAGSTVTLVGEGMTTITASQTGDDNYNAATPVSRELTVSSTAPTEPPPQPDVSAVTLGEDDITIASDSSGATNYFYEVATDPDFNNVIHSTNSANSIVTITGVSGYRALYTRVTAQNTEGDSDPSPVTGTVSRTIPAGASLPISIPIVMNGADRTLDGALGSLLADSLDNGDTVLVWDKDEQEYQTATLNSGVWSANLEVQPGEAFFLQRNNGSPATIVFSGSIQNTGTNVVDVVEGYSLISLSEGYPRDINSAFNNTSGGSPNASILPTAADYLYVQDEEGNWRGFRYIGGGWRDLRTGQNNVSFELAPGEAYYYRRGSGTMGIHF